MRVLIVLCAALVTSFGFLAPVSAQDLSDQEARTIARDAYVYAYPLLLSYATLQRLTNFEKSDDRGHGPANQFNHVRVFPDPTARSVVRENLDTLYTAGTLDLKTEPLVLSVPATDRYFLLPMLSLWSDVFAVPGTRTTGRNIARNFLVVGPEWRESAPSDLDIIRSPTRYVWIIGRTQANGAADYEATRKVQDGYKLTPLSAWGKGDYAPPTGKVDPSIDMKVSPPVAVDNMDAAGFFGQFADLVKENPPNSVDYPMLHRLERIGFHVGKDFDLAKSPPSIKQAIESGFQDGKALVLAEGKKAAGIGNKGWTYTTRTGAYGVDYVYRAAIAQCCLGENLPQDAIYPALSTDSQGRPLTGEQKYVLHFDKGKLPPVDAFWSVTAYDTEGWLVANDIKRYAIGDRDKLTTNADGSLDLYFQANTPGKDREANWLPTGKGAFTLFMRLYTPRDEVANGTWMPPPVVRVGN